ncbi:TetR/AcrR family transcriptional regulator [Ovoidimarina sediminis]|uniref:TetR/AcrR family transcriptional regulator n=1 Tax=Ovoidimarina sediminis TaxID=3079856 RepID=UPI0029071541|nr:TetR/AcrR family transcriptional regulator [Rhodophyticola sp. MJ-SS7]MDU8945735.1 TetR/AcrR family transcriptional regulator [Rhodophyticola sp. MJ-SS7]
MARVTAERAGQTKRELLSAAQTVLVSEGFAGLSTRRVADGAGTQMSQIQYHFGSKEGMILALFESMNAGLIERQSRTFDQPNLSIAEKWDLACDYFDEDIASGYVRVLQELIAAGWSNDKIGSAVRKALAEWHKLLIALVQEAADSQGRVGPFTPEGLAALIACAFMGAEALILLGYEEQIHPIRDVLRQVGEVIASVERQAPEG